MISRIKLHIKNTGRKIYNLSTHLGFKYNLEVYDDNFFLVNQEEGVKMAEWFIPLLQREFSFKSLIDIGCGTAHYPKKCMDLGVKDVFGIEGSDSGVQHAIIPKNLIIKHDLREPFHFTRKWDVALSVEVAEHIDKIYSDNYIKILTDSADTVILTAAHPGQGGVAHVNEQPQSWWKEQFARFGFEFDGQKTKSLRQGILDEEEKGSFVMSWLEPNLMVFRRKK